MWKKLLPIAFATLIWTSPAFAEALYQDFDYGAAESQVLAKFPGAKLDEHNSAGAIRAYRLEAYPAPGMWAYFRFDAGGLVEVKLYGRGAAQYLEIVDALKSRYGAPTSEAKAAQSGVAIWRRKSTTITAALESSYGTVVGRVTEPFSVTYSAADDALKSSL